jgi:predicted RNA-binding Zn-ribbon protein involved in translation (DUF1610 family)
MDKFKNAIGIIKACGLNIKGDRKLMEEANQVERTIIEALEKQIPKKPIVHGFREGREVNTISFTCPICNKHIGRENYCKHCGQALLWEEKKCQK